MAIPTVAPPLPITSYVPAVTSAPAETVLEDEEGVSMPVSSCAGWGEQGCGGLGGGHGGVV